MVKSLYVAYFLFCMCFSPIVSIVVALFEFSVAGYILLTYKKSKAVPFFGIYLFVLGMYQFTEFMLCVGNYSALWATLGILLYTFLPAIGVHFMFRLFRYRGVWVVYLLPIIFSLLVLLTPQFVRATSCYRVFVSVETLFFGSRAGLGAYLYWIYYFFYIVVIVGLFSRAYWLSKSGPHRTFCVVGIGCTLLSMVPALVLLAIMPQLKIVFPSMYCLFAVLFAFCALIVVRLDEEHKILP